MDLLYDIKTILNSLIIFLCVVFSIFLLSGSNKKRTGNTIFVFVLISLGLSSTQGIMIHQLYLNKLIYHNIPWLYYYPFTFRYLWVPLLYLFTITLTRSEFKIKKSFLLHILPFAIIFLRVLLLTLLKSPEEIRTMINSNQLFNSIESRFYYLIEYVQFYSYTIASLIVIHKYRRNLKIIYSTVDHINLSWLSFVFYGFILWKSLRLTGTILMLFIGMSPVYIPLYIITQIMFVTFLSIIFLKGLKHPKIFLSINGNQLNKKYEKTLLSEELRKKYSSVLIQYMNDNKPYLDPSLNLSSLSRQLNIPSHHLSQILNDSIQQNFYYFINSYRIKESIRLIKEGDSTKTILEILYETGFNSKSVFNSYFRKFTNMSPTQFRRIHKD